MDAVQVKRAALLRIVAGLDDSDFDMWEIEHEYWWANGCKS